MVGCDFIDEIKAPQPETPNRK